jgi:hypothetical protein
MNALQPVAPVFFSLAGTKNISILGPIPTLYLISPADVMPVHAG